MSCVQWLSRNVNNDISVLLNLLRIYTQPLFYKTAVVKSIELTFHPVSQSAAIFYAECGQRDLVSLTCEQLTLIENLSADAAQSSLQQVCCKIEPRVLADVAPNIIATSEKMKQHGVVLIVDVHERLSLACNQVNPAVHNLSEHGVAVCLGGYEWERADKRKGYLTSGLYRYVRFANPPRYLHEANQFLDSCFELVEKSSCGLIIDRVQSRTQFEMVKMAPYHALKGDYLGRPRLLSNGIDA
ncbi:hypothetical protein [Aeromonas sp. 602200]|uniref:hypothetical protein n=1 Tax=Aeromonas sp. 602200 TaxID=2712040 RepID=UPI003BA32E32